MLCDTWRCRGWQTISGVAHEFEPIVNNDVRQVKVTIEELFPVIPVLMVSDLIALSLIVWTAIAGRRVLQQSCGALPLTPVVGFAFGWRVRCLVVDSRLTKPVWDRQKQWSD